MSGKPLLMLVEDDADIRDTIVELLERKGYQMMAAEDGQQALTRLRDAAIKPRLIFLDLTMPVMNGWEFMAVQSTEPGLATIPVVVLSAVAHAEREHAGSTRTWAGILMKPVNLQVLIETVQRYCPHD